MQQMGAVKKFNPAVAGLLNSLMPGLGFLYTAHPLWACFTPIALFVPLAVMSWSKWFFSGAGPALTFGMVAILAIISVWLAVTQANQEKTQRLPSTRWYVYAMYAVAVTLLSNTLVDQRRLLFGFDIFQQSNVSMETTMLSGDVVLADTWAYKNRLPRRGDLVIFRPVDGSGEESVKRVIGLPGEEVLIRDGKLYINGTELREPYLFSGFNKRAATQNNAYTVPAKTLFVLGDNRDNSADSRSWGFLPVANLVGQVRTVWFSFDEFEGVRPDRSGRVLR